MDTVHNCPVCGSPHITAKLFNTYKCDSCDATFKLKEPRNVNLTTSEIYKKTISSILEINTIVDGEEQFGTGIVVSSKGHILTCAHLISESIEEKTIVKNFCDAILAKDNKNEKMMKTELIFLDGKNDLALLYSEEAKKYPPINISKVDIKTGERVCAIGNSKGEGLCIVDGIISDSRRNVGDNEYIVVSAPVTSGYSGGPVFNSKGNLIGVIKGGRDGAVAMNYAIPTIKIQNLINKNNSFSY